MLTVLAAVMMAAFLALALVVAAAYWLIFRRPLPRTEGRVQVDGLRSPAEVVRDARGVPRIVAADLRDACFAIGFVHGQDRLWQMEMQRMLASGRLSEVVGPRALSVDRLMRRLGLRRVSEAEWHVTHATGAVREELLAYAAGVNAAMRDRPLPAEFTILRHRPALWEPEDTLTVGRLLSFSQAGNWEAQLVRMRLLKELGSDLTQALDPVLAGAGPLPADELATSAGTPTQQWLDELRSAEDLLALSAWTPASNSWVVHGSRTSTGAPLLANDPHGPIGIPSPWYRLNVRFGDRELTGLTFCGAPYLPFGRNRRVAWGVVNANVSIQDLYVERFNPNNPLQFDDCGTWQDAVRFREVIRVRGARPEVEDVLVTRRGPVISPALDGNQPPMSLRWVGFDSEVDSISWARGINLAQDWPGFRAAVSSMPSPALGVTYADVDGNVGYRLSGFIPLRRPGQGRVPSRGWERDDEWRGFVALEEMPELFNPPSGQVIAANQPVAVDPARHAMVEEPAGRFRAERIGERLAAVDTVSPELCAEIQGDLVSTAARRFRASVLEVAERFPAAGHEDAIRLLRGWDCRIDPGSGAAALYERALGHLYEALVARRISPGLRRYLRGAGATDVFPDGPYSGRMTAGVLRLVSSLAADGRAAGLDVGVEAIWEALGAAWAELVSSQGGDPGRWRLARSRKFILEHPLAGAFGALAPILSRGPFPVAGDPDTVRVGSLAGRDGRAGRLTSAFFRAVYDLGGGGSGWAAVPGQSGHPASAHYADGIADWLEARLAPMPMDAPSLEGRRLLLEPAPAEAEARTGV